MKLSFRRFGGMLAGAAPLFGAVISLVWLGWSNQSTEDASTRALAMASHPFGAIAIIQAIYTGLLSLLWMRYRPFKAPEGVEWPKVTVVIPAFNEGPMVGRSIRSVAACNYPKDKLEVIVVDDGSRDDTFFHMQHLRREFPELVRLVRFVGNRGKRSALVAGFRAATGSTATARSTPTRCTRWSRRSSPTRRSVALRGAWRCSTRTRRSAACSRCSSRSPSTTAAPRSRCTAPSPAARAR
jgi:hypothetical protein